jgi:glucose/mannose-6-phosphate isomerase
MIDLDNLDLARLDTWDMHRRTQELPQQCRDAWQAVQSLPLPADYAAVDRVAIAGMGGSAIGGDLARAIVGREARLPISVLRDYDVPGWVDSRTLFIASSYSGNTEETLSAFAQASQRGAKIVAVTTGGKLQAAAEETGVPTFVFSYRSAPRAALGYSLMAILGVFYKVGLIADMTTDIAETVEVLEKLKGEIDVGVPMAVNPAKRMAINLHGKLPVVYGAGLLADVARRWKTQINENTKGWAFFEVLPELDHNALEGYRFPAELAERVVVIMLTSTLDHPRVTLRQRLTGQILGRAGVPVQTVVGRGQSALAQVLSAVHFGDYVSLYLAFLYGVDPSPMPAVDFLKAELSKAG